MAEVTTAPKPRLKMVSVDEAQQIVRERARPLPSEVVALHDAFGRVAAVTLRATADLVPFPRSAMDGYAVCAADTSAARNGAIVRLPVAGAVFAEKGGATHAPGTATAISTGAPIPRGADAVIPFEEVEREGDVIVIRQPAAPGNHVFPEGEDAHGGDVLFEAGQELTPGRIGLAALAGFAKIAVHRRPRVAIVCTGDELVEISGSPEHGQIRNSNLPMLAALAAQAGAQVASCKTIPDDRALLRDALTDALDANDFVITTGGASAGPRDFVKATLTELGVEFSFGSIAMRPGRPTGFGCRGETLVTVLPGNPAAAFVGFAEVARPALRRRAGWTEAFYADAPAVLDGEIRAKANRTYFVFGRLGRTESGLRVIPIDNQCSALVRTSADANALIVLRPGEAKMQSGDRVAVHLLEPTTSS